MNYSKIGSGKDTYYLCENGTQAFIRLIGHNTIQVTRYKYANGETKKMTDNYTLENWNEMLPSSQISSKTINTTSENNERDIGKYLLSIISDYVNQGNNIQNGLIPKEFIGQWIREAHKRIVGSTKTTSVPNLDEIG